MQRTTEDRTSRPAPPPAARTAPAAVGAPGGSVQAATAAPDGLGRVLARAVRGRAAQSAQGARSLQRHPGPTRKRPVFEAEDLDLLDLDDFDDLDDGDVDEDLDEEAARYLYRPGTARHKHTVGQHLDVAFKPLRTQRRSEARRQRAAETRATSLEQQRIAREAAYDADEEARDQHMRLPTPIRSDARYKQLWVAFDELSQVQYATRNRDRDLAGWYAAARACIDRGAALRAEAEQRRRTALVRDPRKVKRFTDRIDALLKRLGDGPAKARTEAARRRRELRKEVEALNVACSDGFSIEHEERYVALEQRVGTEVGDGVQAQQAVAPVLSTDHIFDPPLDQAKMKTWIDGLLPVADDKNITDCTSFILVHTNISGGGTGTTCGGLTVFHISHGKSGSGTGCTLFFTKAPSGQVQIVGIGQHVSGSSARYRLVHRLPQWTHATKFIKPGTIDLTK